MGANDPAPVRDPQGDPEERGAQQAADGVAAVEAVAVRAAEARAARSRGGIATARLHRIQVVAGAGRVSPVPAAVAAEVAKVGREDVARARVAERASGASAHIRVGERRKS